MKPNKKLAYYFFLVILCTNLTGCGTIPSYEELGNGYVEATYTRTSFSEPSAHRISLQYRKGWHTVVIWPSLESSVFVNDDVAVFIGLMGNKETRLFAVKMPNPPMDITDEVLWRWSKESGKGFADALKVSGAGTLGKKGYMLEFHFTFWAREDWPRTVNLGWSQISDIMREVKEKGVERKDRVWGTSYIEKEFKPTVQK
jgi:hypothetical protein